MDIRYKEVGVCGLSCRLCPHRFTEGESRCDGCKGEMRMEVGCPFITCAVKRKGVEFCWQCDKQRSCERWAGHRQYGREHDTFVCYAALEDNIERISRDGIGTFVEDQLLRETLLEVMIKGFNEGRSKTYYSIAATLLDPHELRAALDTAESQTAGETDVRRRSKALHAKLDAIAASHSLKLALRK